MAKYLEVIVTSVKEAIEAEAGGANRLELVRNLEVGGLTPHLRVIRAVLESVDIPVRVMLRESADMALHNGHDLHLLRGAAKEAAQLPIDGFVMGFLQGDSIDREAMANVLSATDGHRVTFHRAFDELPDPASAIPELKRLGQIDRILTVGGTGDWLARKERLVAWQAIASPEITLLVGAGIEETVLTDLAATPQLQEVHVGRAARVPHLVTGTVERSTVGAIASRLR
ncbi:MAG TPA: copper homeostasis protein CutC [Bryobacteraceae bacterium]|jgi:copper homeostasis protein|nr:copper homeostasis protein CutC [Bryobacteraceae bacterium]